MLADHLVSWMEFFGTWLCGLLLVLNFQVVWSRTNLPQHVWNWFHPKDQLFTKDELVAATLRYGAWGDLWICGICAGQHVAWTFVSFLALGAWMLDAPVNLFAVGFGWLSWTGVAGVLTAARPIERASKNLFSDLVLPPPPQSPTRSPAPEETAAPAAETDVNKWVNAVPSEAAVKLVSQMILDMRKQTGGVSSIPPLFGALQRCILSPKTQLQKELSQAYTSADSAAHAARCKSCEHGEVLRRFMALAYDAGAHKDGSGEVS